MKVPSSFTAEQRLYLLDLVSQIDEARALALRETPRVAGEVPRNPETLTVGILNVKDSIYIYDITTQTYQQVQADNGVLTLTDSGKPTPESI